VSLFTSQAATELPGPDWLKERRVLAVKSFLEVGMPTPEAEEWRYSPIADFSLDSWQPALTKPAAAATETATSAATSEFLSEVVPNMLGLAVCLNGWLVHSWLSQEAEAAGVRFGLAQELPPMETNGDMFRLLTEAFAPQPLELVVPAGQVLDGVFVVAHDFTGFNTAAFPWLTVNLGENSEAKVLDFTGLDIAGQEAPALASDQQANLAPASASAVTSSPASVSATSDPDPVFTAPLVNLSVGKAARLKYLNFQNLPQQAWQIASQVAEVESQATLVSSTVALGGSYARQRTDTRLIGRGATGNIATLSFADNTQTIDFRTFHSHIAQDTSSQLLFKGAIDDEARSIYTGLIRVGAQARGTNAFQTNRNLKLSADAWAESVPNLEIENNDVVCSHASTVGPVEEEQMFYLESRGVPSDVAERLIVDGFFDEVLRKLSVPEAVPLARLALHEKLPYEFED